MACWGELGWATGEGRPLGRVLVAADGEGGHSAAGLGGRNLSLRQGEGQPGHRASANMVEHSQNAASVKRIHKTGSINSAMITVPSHVGCGNGRRGVAPSTVSGPGLWPGPGPGTVTGRKSESNFGLASGLAADIARQAPLQPSLLKIQKQLLRVYPLSPRFVHSNLKAPASYLAPSFL